MPSAEQARQYLIAENKILVAAQKLIADLEALGASREEMRARGCGSWPPPDEGHKVGRKRKVEVQ